jgi:uncharacterized membrane protein
MNGDKEFSDKDIEIILGNLLRWGVIFSSIIIFTGGIIYLLRHGNSEPDYKSFQGLLHPFHNLAEVVEGAAAMKGQAIIQAGIICLIATPVARIIFSIFGFLREKDRLYIVISLIVLCIILSSMIFGIKG